MLHSLVFAVPKSPIEPSISYSYSAEGGTRTRLFTRGYEYEKCETVQHQNALGHQLLSMTNFTSGRAVSHALVCGESIKHTFGSSKNIAA
jgi:hypothetical protein